MLYGMLRGTERVMGMNDYLSAAEIADIRARWECLVVAIGIDRSLTPDEEVAAEDDLRKLLAHLDALQAPADGETLGRMLHRLLSPIFTDDYISAVWEGWKEETRVLYRTTALALHARGYAAGLARGEEEQARLAEDLEGDRRAYAVRAETERTEIARLTAELAEVRKEATAVREDVVHSMTREADARVAAAKRDGAREERERWQRTFVRHEERPIVFPRDLPTIEADAANRGDPWTIEIVGRLGYSLAATFAAWSEENDARCEGESEWAREQVTKEREACAAVARRVPGSVDPSGIGESIALAIEHRGEGGAG